MSTHFVIDLSVEYLRYVYIVFSLLSLSCGFIENQRTHTRTLNSTQKLTMLTIPIPNS